MKILSKQLLPVILQVALCAWPQSAPPAPQANSPDKTQPPPSERVVLSIGDQKMTAGEVEKFLQAMPANYRAYYGGPGKRLLAQYIVRMKFLSAEAIKEKLDQQPDVALALEIARESILTEAARKHIEEGITVSDQELRELYQKDKTRFEEVRIAHILIRTENPPLKSGDASHPGLPDSEARKKLEDIRQQILAGADFAQMAKQYSEDTDTAASGGEIGVLQPDKIVPPIVNAAHSLALGQVSDVIQTPSGLEIIKVEDKHTKSFEETRSALEAQLRQTKGGEIVRNMLANYPFVIDQEYFGGSPATQTSPPSPPKP